MKSMNCQNVKYVGVLVILYLPNEKLLSDAKICVATSCNEGAVVLVHECYVVVASSN